MKFELRYRRALFGLVGMAVAGSMMMVPAAIAQEESDVTQEILAGSLTASIADAAMTDVNYSQTEGGSTGTLVLSVNDMTGSGLGWTVSVSSSDFVYGGTSTAGVDIPVEGFVITTPQAPVVIEGQGIGLGGPTAQAGGSLDIARTPLHADVGFGSGSYTQELPVTLVIPAFSQAGSYVATLTVTVSSAP